MALSYQARAAHDPSIATTLARLYEAISFEEGDEPDWSKLTDMFCEQARITRITPEGTDYMDRARFLAMTRDLFEAGAYTSFYEFEMARQVSCFGNLAQVWSMYETRRNRTAQSALNRGVNSIQLLRDERSWKVLSLLWDEVHAHEKLDLNHVFTEASHA